MRSAGGGGGLSPGRKWEEGEGWESQVPRPCEIRPVSEAVSLGAAVSHPQKGSDTQGLCLPPGLGRSHPHWTPSGLQ